MSPSLLGQSLFAKPKPAPTNLCNILLDRLFGAPEVPEMVYFLRSAPSMGELQSNAGKPSDGTFVWQQVFRGVAAPESGPVQLEVRRVRADMEARSELVGTVDAADVEGFHAYPVMCDGAATGMTLRLSVSIAVAETAVVRVDMLFDTEPVPDASYFVHAGLPGCEACVTPPVAAKDDTHCRWRHVLSGVPQTKDGISVVIYRSSSAGVERLGRVSVPHKTIGFVTFAVLAADGRDTGMSLRLCVPPLEAPAPARRAKWFFARRTAASPKKTGSFNFTAEQLEVMKQFEQKSEKQNEEEEADQQAPRATRKRPTQKRPTRRSTCRKTDASSQPAWSDDGSEAGDSPQDADDSKQEEDAPQEWPSEQEQVSPQDAEDSKQEDAPQEWPSEQQQEPHATRGAEDPCEEDWGEEEEEI